MDLMGFTLRYAKTEFDRGLEEDINKTEGWAATEPFEDFRNACAERLLVLRSLTFESWSTAFLRIWTEDLPPTHPWAQPEPLPFRYGQPIDLMLGKGLEFYGFPAYDSRVFLRAAFEVLDPTTRVAQDLTDLLVGGWIDTTSDLCAHADYLVTADFATTQRVIVLTEGVSDKRASEGALRVPYPHLVQYFTFMDFEQMNVPGGAGPLVNFVKAFVAAGILNRILAVFDNDTAAQSALRALRGLAMHDNVRVVQYPSIELAKNYPTIGPSGVSNVDVNGLAGSPELYFGRDVLSRADGTLTPVQWRGFDQALGRYQGEILDKADLQARFQVKVDRCLQNLALVTELDWSGMDAVLTSLRTAFHDADPLMPYGAP